MHASLLIYNPAAGQRWKRPDPERVRAALREQGREPELRLTRGQDHATELVREALGRGVTEVWVCGGDGTIAQAAAALVGSDVPLGILPIGTANVLASECGIPTDPFRAIRSLSERPTRRPFRTWSVGGRALLLGVGVGFEARTIGYTDPALKDWLGFGALGARGVLEWVRYEFPRLRVSGEDEKGAPFDRRATQLLATSPRRYAGQRVVVPDADPADDLLDLILLEGRSHLRLAALWAGIQLPGMLHLRVPGVSHLRARRARVEALGDRAVEVHVNGDLVERTPVDMEPWGRVWLLAPAAQEPGVEISGSQRSTRASHAAAEGRIRPS